MRSWTDRLVLAGLALAGGGLLSVGSGKALARFTISGSPVLVVAPDGRRFTRGDSEFTQLADADGAPYGTSASTSEWPGAN